MDPTELVAHIPSLRRYARALTGDAWAADDLVQDTLERACAKRLLWTVGTDLRAWLFTLMHHLQSNQWQRAARQRAAGRAVDVADVAAELVAPDQPTETTIDLQRCLLQLPEEQRIVLLLVTLEDLTYDAVARITGVPVGTVMSRLSRARQRLQQLLDAAPTATPSVGTAPTPLRRLK
ncbi:MAG: RNA polymerase sigma factor [Hydrogenophaga sp.]|uniref:RNA polymerase sigma factor n=1 Tax=Hydrogenophaga sp. TaxID=1904254 RepID=UPI003D9BA57E